MVEIMMKYKLFSVLIIAMMLSSCEYTGTSSLNSSQMTYELDYEKKMEYYFSYGGNCVYTWCLANGKRRYGCLGKQIRNYYGTAYSYNKILYAQYVVPLNINETKEYLKWLYEKISDIAVYLIEIPYPISEIFYYDGYLLNFPDSRFFVQDYSLWEELVYGIKGYDELKKNGHIIES